MKEDTLNDEKVWLDLNDYITPKSFRTVDMPSMEEKPAYTELKVIIEIKQDFADSLSIHVEKINMVGGYAAIQGKLEAVNGSSDCRFGRIEQLYLTEVEDRFNMSVCYKDGAEKIFYVKKEIVKELIENCEMLCVYHRTGKYEQ